MTEVMKPSLVATALRSLRLLVVCVGRGSCSAFVHATIFAPDQAPSMCWLPWCSGAAQERRSGFAGSASTWLTVLRAHELVLLRQQRPHGRASRRLLQRFSRAASDRVPYAPLFSRIVLAARACAKRCREPPCSGSSARCSGADFADFSRTPQIFPEDNRHCFEDYRPYAKYL